MYSIKVVDEYKRKDILKLLKYNQIKYTQEGKFSINVNDDDNEDLIKILARVNSQHVLEPFSTEEEFKEFIQKLTVELIERKEVRLKIEEKYCDTYTEDPGYYCEERCVAIKIYDKNLSWDDVEGIVSNTDTFKNSILYESVLVIWDLSSRDSELMLVFY